MTGGRGAVDLRFWLIQTFNGISYGALTNSVATIADHPHIPNARLWNPAGMTFDEACKAMGVPSGKAAVTGGTGVFGLF
jgi:hypothetical protein